MRKILAAAAGLVLAACSANAGWSGDTVQTSGVTGQRSFQVGNFETVALMGSHNVVVTVGGAAAVRAEGDTAMLEWLDVRVENGRLLVGTRRDAPSFQGRGQVTVYVTAPSLTGAEIAGSGDMRVSALQAPRFRGGVAGSGDLMLDGVQAEAASFSISGSGDIRAAGRTRQASLTIAGSGDASLESLQMETAEISIAGSGDAQVHATGSVAATIVGSGNVVVRGGARCTLSRVGSGELRCG